MPFEIRRIDWDDNGIWRSNHGPVVPGCIAPDAVSCSTRMLANTFAATSAARIRSASSLVKPNPIGTQSPFGRIPTTRKRRYSGLSVMSAIVSELADSMRNYFGFVGSRPTLNFASGINSLRVAANDSATFFGSPPMIRVGIPPGTLPMTWNRLPGFGCLLMRAILSAVHRVSESEQKVSFYTETILTTIK